MATQHEVSIHRKKNAKNLIKMLSNNDNKAEAKNANEKIHNERRMQTLQRHYSFDEKTTGCTVK
nr:hypothetical protein [Lactiplantibacillus plantarum]